MDMHGKTLLMAALALALPLAVAAAIWIVRTENASRGFHCSARHSLEG